MWPLREPGRLQAPLPALTGPQAKREACQVLSTTRRQRVAQGMLMSTDVYGMGEGKSESPGNLGESIPSGGSTDHGCQGRHRAINHARWGAAGQGAGGGPHVGGWPLSCPDCRRVPGRRLRGCCEGGRNGGVLGLSVRVCFAEEPCGVGGREGRNSRALVPETVMAGGNCGKSRAGDKSQEFDLGH